MAKTITVVGGGLGGLATAALMARAGHEVTLIEGNDWLGGKSRRIDIAGQRIDTGPSLVTFPGVWEEVLRTWDSLGGGPSAESIAGVTLERLPEVGRYYFRGQQANLPVEEGHPWHEAWQRFQGEHGSLHQPITDLLTKDPWDPGILGAGKELLSRYGTKLTTQSYLDSLKWMPEDLKEVIAIHTLNAGVSPDQTLALYATMAAVMAEQGVFVPRGGVYEIARGLENLARAAGVTIHTGEAVVSIAPSSVTTAKATYSSDYVVGAVDGGILESLMGKKPKPPRKLSCSGVAIFGVLEEELPPEIVTHSVMMPDQPDGLFTALGKRHKPDQTMAFLNYYRAGEIYPNDRPVAALLLTAPPDGLSASMGDDFVQQESRRFSDLLGLKKSVVDMMSDSTILDPEYFAGFGAVGGALYGAPAPWWRSGPFHSPAYNTRTKPWLWRVGSSVHPGGGIPAVLGGVLIATRRMRAAF